MTTSSPHDGRDLAHFFTPIGVWLNQLARVGTAQAVELAQEIEDLGAGVLWIGEMPGSKEPTALAGALLAGTKRLRIATGIMSIWTHPAPTTLSAAHTLAEAYDDRFILGLGVSHREARPGLGPVKPLSALRQYLDEMDAATYGGPPPARPVPRVLAALGPKMQELAASRASGMHSFFVNTEHTAAARERLGPGPLLCPEQGVVVHDDLTVATEVARAQVRSRLALDNYVNHLRRLGFDDADLADGGSDRLVHSMIASGDAETVAARIQCHHEAGADHVAVHPLDTGDRPLEDVRRQLRALLPLLTS